MSHHHQNFDTTFTKIYVGGLPWTTRKEGLINFFKRFGEIIHVNVVCDRETDRSQGYGFVTFKDAESATRACKDPNPTIEGRITNCKLAFVGAKVKPNQSQPSNLPQLLPRYDPQYNPRYDPMSYQQNRMANNTNNASYTAIKEGGRGQNGASRETYEKRVIDRSLDETENMFLPVLDSLPSDYDLLRKTYSRMKLEWSTHDLISHCVQEEERLTNEKKEHDLVAGKVICDKKRKQYDECLEAVLGN
ncbi:unnamed protein product [Arabidopsis thaliana]|nr:unnamed protein product [Arabidopsis thaliana]